MIAMDTDSQKIFPSNTTVEFDTKIMKDNARIIHEDITKKIHKSLEHKLSTKFQKYHVICSSKHYYEIADALNSQNTLTLNYIITVDDIVTQRWTGEWIFKYPKLKFLKKIFSMYRLWKWGIVKKEIVHSCYLIGENEFNNFYKILSFQNFCLNKAYRK